MPVCVNAYATNSLFCCDGRIPLDTYLSVVELDTVGLFLSKLEQSCKAFRIWTVRSNARNLSLTDRAPFNNN